MTIEEQFNQDVEYNAKHPIFADEQDDLFGCHSQGCYQQFSENANGDDVIRFVFDNGNVYDINQDTGEFEVKGSRPQYVFIHRHLQNLINEFRLQKTLPSSVAADVMCAANEVTSLPFVRIIINRDERWIGITNFILDPQYQHQNIGKDFLKKVFTLCKEYGFHLRLLNCMASFYTRMVARGATVLVENNHLEITDATVLENHH